jgi:hypothetical protein
MKGIITGSILAAIAMFLWGFVFFGTPVGGATYSKLTLDQESAMAAALNEAVPADGAYVLPGPMNGSEESFAARMAAGPLATVHFRRAGAATMDPSIMIKGFVHMLATAALLGWILHHFGKGLTGYGSRFGLVASIGVAAALWVDVAQPIWWHHSWQHHLMIAFYDIVGVAIAAAILARFVRAPSN